MRTRRQQLLPFGRAEQAKNRGVRLGRPPKPGSVSHQAREALPKQSVLHVTLSASRNVPNLRARFRFNDLKEAFAKFRQVELEEGNGFRLVHYNVLGDHLHLIVEADSKEALAKGMRKLNHSISRRLNRSSVLRAGGSMHPLDKTPFSKRPGWLGRIFAARYHAHRLKSAGEIANAVRYVMQNSQKHFGQHYFRQRNAWPTMITPWSRPTRESLPRLDAFSSANDAVGETIVRADSYLVRRAFFRWRESLQRSQSSS
jgi:REP element-mobilizing transposase RayT